MTKNIPCHCKKNHTNCEQVKEIQKENEITWTELLDLS